MEPSEITMMELDLALADVYSSLMQSLEFEHDVERDMVYAHLREAFLAGQRHILSQVMPMIAKTMQEVGRIYGDAA